MPTRWPAHAVLSLALTSSLAYGGGTIHVDDDAPPGGDGATWATAYRYLSDALVAANGAGGSVSTVRIAGGTYRPDQSEANPAGTGDRLATFLIGGGYNIHGGWQGLAGGSGNIRNASLYPVTLSGDLLGDDGPAFANRSDNAFHVVTTDDTTTSLHAFEDLFISSGHADSASSPDDRGGGALVLGDPIFRRCTFTDCWADDRGGGAFVEQNRSAEFESCEFSACEAIDGGGLAWDDSTGSVNSSMFSNNSADRGGGMYAEDDASVDVSASTFTSNHAATRGGGLHVESALVGDATLVNVFGSTFDSNTSDTFGGGVSNRWSTLTIAESSFTGNSSSNDSGALHTLGLTSSAIGETIVTDTTFTGNSADDIGGVARIEEAVASFSCCTFDANTSGTTGGAMRVNRSELNIFDCTFSDNEAALEDVNVGGGALYLSSTPAVISGTTFTGNRGSSGGAILGNSGATSPQGGLITGCTFSGNEATDLSGGALDLGGDYWEVSSCFFESNSAVEQAGALYHSFTLESLDVVDCVFARNTAEDGGAFSLAVDDALFTRCRFEENEALRYGGAVDLRRGTGPSSGSGTFIECDFIRNRSTDAAEARGGAIVVEEATCHLTGCRFLENSSPLSAGAVNIRLNSFCSATNCLFSGNFVEETGAGAVNLNSNADPDSLTLTNCTFVFNSSPVAAGAIRAGAPGGLQMTNCIVRENDSNGAMSESDQIDASGSSVNYCNIQGLTGALGGIGNIDADPMFVDADGPDDIVGTEDDDLRLTPALSTSIDAGDNAADTDASDPGVNPIPSTDLAGGDRFLDDGAVADTGNGAAPIVDLGCYEAGSVAPPAPPASSVIYVDIDATGNNDGTSWSDAYTDLFAALVAAADAPTNTEVWVAEGTYTPASPGGSRARTFAIPSDIEVWGGFDGTESFNYESDPDAHPTILSGDLNGDDSAGFSNRSDNSFHVVTAICTSYRTYLHNLTVSGGSSGGIGGGILLTKANLHIRDCNIIDNEAADAGGGIYSIGGYLECRDGAVSDNRTINPESYGGGIASELRSTVYLTHTTLSGNQAFGGGGLFADTASGRVSLSNVTSIGNSAIGTGSATGFGGALWFVGNASQYSSSRQVYGSTISGCSARIGGGIASLGAGQLYITTSTIDSNSATEQAGGVLFASSGGSLNRSTVLSNTAPIGAGVVNETGSALTVSSYGHPVYPNAATETGDFVNRGFLELRANVYSQIDSLTIHGDFEQAGDMSFEFYEYTPYYAERVGRMRVHGVAQLNGGVLHSYSRRSWRRTQFMDANHVILRADTLSGSFDALVATRICDRDRVPTAEYNIASGAVVIVPQPLYIRANYNGGASASLGRRSTSVAAGQLNSNSWPELILAVRNLSGSFADPGDVIVLDNAGTTGSAWNGWGTSSQYAVGAGPVRVLVAQFDALQSVTTEPDVLTVNSFDNSVTVLRNVSNGTLGDRQDTTVGAGPREAAIADFNGDDLLDVVVANSGDASLSVLFNQGGAGPAWAGLGGRIDIALPGYPYGLSVGDVNGDGDVDILVSARGSGQVWILNNEFTTLARGPIFSSGATIEVGEDPTDIVAADFDGDSALDFAVVNESTGMMTIACGNGDATFTEPITFEIGPTPTSLLTYDAEGDGDADLALIYEDEEDGSLVQEVRNETVGGELSFHALAPINVGATPIGLAVADVDADNDLDLLTANDTLGGNGPPIDSSSLLADIVDDTPVCEGDVDANNAVDVGDISYVIFRLGDTGTPGAVDGDADGDGTVDVNDIGYVIFRLGPCS